MLILALWGLGAMHCKLEALPGMEFLDTCCAGDSSGNDSNGCDTDSCKSVEDASYRAQDERVAAPQPVLSLAAILELPEVSLPAFSFNHLKPEMPPPDIPQGWQFVYRTALPPRAPSLTA